MKQLVHLCFTSKDEVLCRSEEDYWMMISRIAQASIYYKTEVYAYSVMSNHVHLIVSTENSGAFIASIKKSYFQSFNYKYNRKGSFGENGYYKVHLQGHDHILAALVYVLKNPWHHSVSENPYDYPFSSMGLYFRRNNNEPILKSSEIAKKARLLNRNVVLPDRIKYGNNGKIMPESFVEIEMVESFFKTYNAFEYLTHRKNYKEITMSQLEANPEKTPITLESVEPLMNDEKIKDIENRNSYWNKKNDILSDIDVCKLIDKEYLIKYRKKSHTLLSKSEQLAICDDLLRKYQHRVTLKQINRCLRGNSY